MVPRKRQTKPKSSKGGKTSKPVLVIKFKSTWARHILALKMESDLLKGLEAPPLRSRPAVVTAYVRSVGKIKQRFSKMKVEPDMKKRVLQLLDMQIQRARIMGQAHVNPAIFNRTFDRRPKE